VELGLRLRYEIVREFAPYIGVSWERKVGKTADFARDEGEDVDSLAFVTGIRFWF
jgi:copper resistance protein B